MLYKKQISKSHTKKKKYTENVEFVVKIEAAATLDFFYYYFFCKKNWDFRIGNGVDSFFDLSWFVFKKNHKQKHIFFSRIQEHEKVKTFQNMAAAEKFNSAADQFGLYWHAAVQSGHKVKEHIRKTVKRLKTYCFSPVGCFLLPDVFAKTKNSTFS